MFKKLLLTCLIAATGAVFIISSPVIAGTIEGSVKVKGLRSPENILVYLTKVKQSAVNLSESRFRVDQKDLTFSPHVLPIPVGATVDFPNNDKVPHNVFSLSRTKKFNLGYYGPGDSDKVVFDKPGMVELRCDMHAEMSSYIPVMKNIYFGLTDKAGKFSLPDRGYLSRYGINSVKDIPPGKYIVRTWHEKLKNTKQEVEISENGKLNLILELKRGTPGALYKR